MPIGRTALGSELYGPGPGVVRVRALADEAEALHEGHQPGDRRLIVLKYFDDYRDALSCNQNDELTTKLCGTTKSLK